MPTSNTRTVCCIDFGATKVKIEILGLTYGFVSPVEVPTVTRLGQGGFDTTSPNNADEDYRRLRRALDALLTDVGFETISVGTAARLDGRGMIQKGGSLKWAGRNLQAMLECDYGVPTVVANDGAMFAADELVFGVLKDHSFQGRNGIVVVPGTGIATCLFFWTTLGFMIVPGEAQHGSYDRTKLSNGCNCGTYCYESAPGSGAGYARIGVNPVKLDEPDDVANMAPPLGALVTSLVKAVPLLDVVVVSGRIAHKRSSLADAIGRATTSELHGYAPTPAFIQGSSEVGGTRGCLAYWYLTSPR